MIGIWILFILALFFLFFEHFIKPLNEAEKRQAEEKFTLNHLDRGR